MKLRLALIFFFAIQIGFPQQYDSVFIEEENIDSNNKTYKIGNVYIFDYEIIQDGQKYKLVKNNGMFKNREFELAPFFG